jgi:hypothetical protein
MLRLSGAVICSVLFPIFALSACAPSDGGFGIYLAESNQMVLSLADIKMYHSLDFSFDLTASGVSRWNSYFNYTTDVPKPARRLYQQDFFIKLDGKELCRGKFYSWVSSMSYEGIIILDAGSKLTNGRETIKLDFGYPAPSFASETALAEKSRITTVISDFFAFRSIQTSDSGFLLPSG